MPPCRVVCDTLNQLGESPLWHPLEKKLYWVDCFAPAIYCHDPQTHQTQCYPLESYVGAIAYCQSGGLVATTQQGLARVDLDAGTLSSSINLLPSDQALRMNDGKCDRAGRFWAGSAVNDPAMSSACLYRWDRYGAPVCMRSGLKISNGLGWSPDNKTLYHNDSLAKRIFYYDFCIKTGAIGKAHDFTSLTLPGEPDGLTVDSQGGVWIAFWDGAQVIRFTPAGVVDQVIAMPVARPTSVMFGGKDLATLYITSCNHIARRQEVAAPAPAGALFAVEPGFQGLPEAAFVG
jgi:sugar lactone lactonase YvrE